jgi:hypothetical protein
MFEIALILTADSCLYLEGYEMVLYPTGGTFNRETMTPETLEGMLDNVSNHEGRVVDVTTQAAVFAYTKKPLSNDDLETEAIVTSANFVRKSAKGRTMVRPRVKAVVALKCRYTVRAD